MTKKTLFSRQDEFPNYFNMTFDKLVRWKLIRSNIKEYSKAYALAKLETYLSSYLKILIDRLHVPNTVFPGIIEQKELFGELVKAIEHQLTPEQTQKYVIEVSIGGRVIRTLLAKIYREIYEQHYTQDPEGKNINNIDTAVDIDNPKLLFDAEYNLFKSRLTSRYQGKLNAIEVFGVDNALDIYFDVKKQDDSEFTQEEAIEVDAINQKIRTYVPDVIQQSEAYYQSNGIKSIFPYRIAAIGDVQPNQCATLLDELSFSLRDNRFKQAANFKRDAILDFIQGIYQSIDSPSVERMIEGLGPLLEMPFIDLDETSKQHTIKALTKLKSNIIKQDSNLNPQQINQQDIANQTDKLMRNAHLSAGNNRALRESESSPLFILKALLDTLNQSNRRRAYVPRFLNKSASKPKLSAEERGLLCDVNQFISEYTESGLVYHGTINSNLLPILRNAFIISEGYSSSAYGPGLYTTKYFDIANEYARNARGNVFILALNQDIDLRIFDWHKVLNDSTQKACLEKCAREKGYINQNGNVEFNEIYRYLETELGVDIVQNIHTIILNLDAIIMPKAIAPFVIEKIATYRTQLILSASFDFEMFARITNRCISLNRMASFLGAVSTAEANNFYPKLEESAEFMTYLGTLYSPAVVNEIKTCALINDVNFKKCINTLDPSNLRAVLVENSWLSKTLMFFLEEYQYFKSLSLNRENILSILDGMYKGNNYVMYTLSSMLVEHAIQQKCLSAVISFVEDSGDMNFEVSYNMLVLILKAYTPKELFKQLAVAIQLLPDAKEYDKNELVREYLKQMTSLSLEEKKSNICLLMTKENSPIDWDLLSNMWDQFYYIKSQTNYYSFYEKSNQQGIGEILFNVFQGIPQIPDDINFKMCATWILGSPEYIGTFNMNAPYYCSVNKHFSSYLLNAPMTVFLNIINNDVYEKKLLGLAALDPALKEMLAKKISEIEDAESFKEITSRISNKYSGKPLVEAVMALKTMSGISTPLKK